MLSGSAVALFEEPIIADFEAEPTSGPAPLSVNFMDLSDLGPDFDPGTMNISYLWDFGDNQTEEGEDFDEVSHTYEDPGLYTVALNVTVIENGTEVANGSEIKTDYIEVLVEPTDDYPIVNFTAEPLSGNASLNVSFTDLSDFGSDFDPDTMNISYLWEFGDNDTEEGEDLAEVSHVYEEAGLYTVALNVTVIENGTEIANGSDIKVDYIEVLEGEPSPPAEEYPKLDFIGEPRAGVAPLSVNFTPIADLGPDFDPVNMTVEGLWEFGDGTNSTEMNVTHVYENPGVYDVTATVNVIQDSVTIATASVTKEQYIKVFESDAEGIMLSPGWNFISVPYALNNSSVDFLFADVEYGSIIYYDAASEIWLDVEELEPLKGYMVYALDFGIIPLDKLAGVEEPIPGVPGASVPIYEGWNAIGFTDSTQSLSAEFTLGIIDDSYFQVVGPLNQATLTYRYIGRNGYEGEIGDPDDKYVGTDIFLMEPYEGYWVLATENTTLYAVGW